MTNVNKLNKKFKPMHMPDREGPELEDVIKQDDGRVPVPFSSSSMCSTC